jgi:periplasmic protein CpxP/Spy
MSKEKFLVVSVVFLLVLNAGIVAFLFINREPQRPEIFKMVVREVQFDQEQQEKYFALRDEHRASMNQLDESFHSTLNNYLIQLRRDANPVLEDSLANQLANIEKQKATITLSHFRAVRSLCRPDQLADFDRIVPKLTQILLPPQKNHPPRRK